MSPAMFVVPALEVCAYLWYNPHAQLLLSADPLYLPTPKGYISGSIHRQYSVHIVGPPAAGSTRPDQLQGKIIDQDFI